ncbi:zinc metallochaperone AztD [Leucobacter sp. PH1c]|uniref:zinc metallochaperone AztD n=1 Tax=Leucobacter sp. PH1c TaxID=1397278 RepID=UPI00046AB255|nr:zinc metallochaperone AztD [Leucobacter sp. PH1c]
MTQTERARPRASRHSRLLLTVAASAGLALLASGCTAQAGATDESGEQNHAGHSHADHDHSAHADRLAVTTAGGITVLDASALDAGTLSEAGQLDTEEFTRLNSFGDGKHLLVTTSRGFEVLDTDSAKLTGLVFPATAAGHVVRHADRTVLYDDGTGRTTILDTAALDRDNTTAPKQREYTAEAPHHGVSIELGDGTLLTTVGTADGRTGAVALAPHDDHWHEHAVSADCPGIHGEGTAKDEAVVFGCEDGALLFQDGEFTKLSAPDAYGRMGNAFVSEDSPLVVGDYKNDPDAEGYLLSAVTLIDTAAGTLRVAELPENVRYTYRDVVRGPEGHAYILSTDGSIHVLDAATGKIVNEFPVIAAWEGPANWQDPHPTIVTDGSTAYVTEPAAKTVHAVDLESGKTLASAKLAGVPNEIAIARG